MLHKVFIYILYVCVNAFLNKRWSFWGEIPCIWRSLNCIFIFQIIRIECNYTNTGQFYFFIAPVEIITHSMPTLFRFVHSPLAAFVERAQLISIIAWLCSLDAADHSISLSCLSTEIPMHFLSFPIKCLRHGFDECIINLLNEWMNGCMVFTLHRTIPAIRVMFKYSMICSEITSALVVTNLTFSWWIKPTIWSARISNLDCIEWCSAVTTQSLLNNQQTTSRIMNRWNLSLVHVNYGDSFGSDRDRETEIQIHFLKSLKERVQNADRKIDGNWTDVRGAL